MSCDLNIALNVSIIAVNYIKMKLVNYPSHFSILQRYGCNTLSVTVLVRVTRWCKKSLQRVYEIRDETLGDLNIELI